MHRHNPPHHGHAPQTHVVVNNPGSNPQYNNNHHHPDNRAVPPYQPTQPYRNFQNPNTFFNTPCPAEYGVPPTVHHYDQNHNHGNPGSHTHGHGR